MNKPEFWTTLVGFVTLLVIKLRRTCPPYGKTGLEYSGLEVWGFLMIMYPINGSGRKYTAVMCVIITIVYGLSILPDENADG